MTPAPETARRAAGALPSDDLAELEEERDFLLASLDDLEREYEAGDLDDDDYKALREDYTARAAAAVRAVRLQRREVAAAERPPGKKRLIAGVMAALLLAVIAGVMVAQFSGRRSAGEQVSGNVATAKGAPAGDPAATVQPDADTQKCMAKMASAFGGTNGGAPTGSPVDALRCFDAVLKKNPNNVAALTFRGWTGVQLARELSGSGVASKDQVNAIVQSATANLQKALRLVPTNPTALIFSAYDAFYAGDFDSARGLLARFDALGITSDATLSSLVDPLRDALKKAPTGSSTAPSSAPPKP